MKPTKQELYSLYIEKNLTQDEIAAKFNLSPRSIRYYLNKYNITKRNISIISKSELQKQLDTGNTITDIANYFNCSRDKIYSYLKKYNLSREDRIDIDTLKKLYVDKNYNITQLMNYFNFSDRKGIINRLKKYNINNSLKDDITFLYKNSFSIEEISSFLQLNEKDVLYNLQHHSIWREKPVLENISLPEFTNIYKNKSNIETAKYFNCSVRTIHTYAKRYNIQKNKEKFSIDYDVLHSLYINKNLSMDEIASLYNVSRKTINNIINQYNIIERPRKSSQENKIAEILDTLGIKYIRNNRSILKPKELDFFLPDLNIAIEHCGLYWHSTAINDNKYHIFLKYKECLKNNIQLITIFEDEINNNFDIVKNRLTAKLQKNMSKIYARNCDIRIIDARLGIDFLNNNHIQKAGKNNIYIGAFYKDKLVGVMAFSKPSVAKGNADYDWELNRFAVEQNIIGLPSKLFKYFIVNFNPKSIVSYSDNRWNTGALYSILNFKFRYNTKPNYWYTNGKGQRYHRFKYTKQKLLQLFPNENPSQTEEQIAYKYGFYRVYDCGSKVFTWRKND